MYINKEMTGECREFNKQLKNTKITGSETGADLNYLH